MRRRPTGRHLVETAGPRAVLVSGAPGSGKSTVAALIARELHAALLDLDTATASLTAVIAQLHGTDNLDDPDLARVTRAARYEAIVSLAEDNLAAGIGAVMVAPFTAERRDPLAWERLQRRLHRAGASVMLVWLRITADEVVRRVEQRGEGRDLAKRGGGWPAGLDLDPPAVPHLAVDAMRAPAAVAETVMASLGVDSLRPTRGSGGRS